MMVLPAGAANHFYTKSSVVWNSFMITSVLYSVLSNLAMTCLQPIPVVNRALPAVRRVDIPVRARLVCRPWTR